MYSALDFEKRNENLKKFRDFNSKAELIEELKAEWNNALLFASKAVIIDFQKFILKQDQKNYFETILSMRNDLYGGKNKIQINDLKL